MAIRAYKYHRAIARIKAASGMVDNPPPDAIAARFDFSRFRHYVCGHETYPHHQVWDQELNTGKSNKILHAIAGDDTLILAPRGSSKSTYLVEWVAYQIGTHAAPDVGIALKVLYVSYTVDIAMLKSIQIKQLIETPLYQKVFPWVRPGEKWADKLWVIDRHHAGLTSIDEPYTLACSGLKGGIASKRSALIVFDDIIKSPKQIEKDAVRREMSSNWTSVIRPTMFEGARAVCLGTRMRPDDIYTTDFIPDKGWKQLIQSAIISDPVTKEERSYWESGQSLKFLQESRSLDPVAFSYQYQNIIVRVSEQTIDPSWIVASEVPDVDEMDAIAMGVDLSSSLSESADYTVMILAGRKGNIFYVLDMRRMRCIGNLEKLDAIIEMWRDWECPQLKVSVDSTSYQASLSGDFQSYVTNELGIYDLTCNPVIMRGDKLSRLRSVSALFQNRCVVFNQYAHLRRLRDELVSFGSIDHDDCLDALVLCIQDLRAARKLEIL